MNLRRYLATLSTGRLVLWCYFIWYAVVLVEYFDPSPRLWLTSLGIAAIVGFALYLSTAGTGAARTKLDRWQIFRFFLMPFCVSSFAALVKGRGFFLVFSPKPAEVLLAAVLCATLCVVVLAVKRLDRARAAKATVVPHRAIRASASHAAREATAAPSARQARRPSA